MALPLKYNIRNIVVRKGSTLATAFTIGLTVAVFLMVMALARGIDLTLSSSGEPLNVIVLREGSTARPTAFASRRSWMCIGCSSLPQTCSTRRSTWRCEN